MTTIRELLKTDDLTNLALIFKNPALKILDLPGSGDATDQAIKDVSRATHTDRLRGALRHLY